MLDNTKTTQDTASYTASRELQTTAAAAMFKSRPALLLSLVVFVMVQFSGTESHSLNLQKSSRNNVKKAAIDCGSSYTCSDCSDSSYVGTVNSLAISPNPPTQGSNITVSAGLTLDQTINSGDLTLKVTILVFGIPVTTTDEYNICDITSGGCPASGTVTVNFNKEVPSLSPKGKYTGSATAEGKDAGGSDKDIICVDLEFDLE